jgi:hypothetical protein
MDRMTRETRTNNCVRKPWAVRGFERLGFIAFAPSENSPVAADGPAECLASHAMPELRQIVGCWQEHRKGERIAW